MIESVGWLWEKFGKEITEKVKGTAVGLWSRIQWPQKEAAYRQRLLDHYSTTKVLGNPKDIRIDDIYTDALVLEKVAAFQRMSIQELEEYERYEIPDIEPSSNHVRRGHIKVRRIPLEELAKREKRLYILGKPGAGKSTFLRHITLLCCRGEIAKTPIFVPMKAWSDSGLSLSEFIDKEFEICAFPSARPFVQKLLHSGNALVLFDGLDEVNQEGELRARTIKALTDFARTYPETQIFVTCRVAATDYSFEKFVYVEVADFTDKQQREFVAKWYADMPQRLERFENEWKRQENEGLRVLARTPLLLTLMCLAFDETLSFPRRRVEVYQEALGALLKRWDSSRGIVRDGVYRRLSLVRKEQLLSRIAAQTFRASQFFIPKNNLIRMIDEYLLELPPQDREEAGQGDVVLQAMEVQHGILIERAFGIYAFSHLTFHEYFAARFHVDNSAGGRNRSTG